MFDSLKNRQPGMIDLSEYKRYALGIPLVSYKGRLCILFEVRAHTLAHQPGEVCLPGGRVEDGEDFLSAAVRETSEELSISPEQIDVIAPMDVYMSLSGQLVAPYLMALSSYEGSFNAGEVDHVFYVPVGFFLDNEPEVYKNKVYTEPGEDFPLEKIPGGRRYPWHSGWSTVYFYPEYEGHRIWGLTAKIMRSAAAIMKNAEICQEDDYVSKENTKTI